MNIAYSILSDVAGVEAAATAEAYSGPWKNVIEAVQSTAEAGSEQSGGAIDRILALPDAHTQLTDSGYWGSVGIITITGILVVFFILIILIFLFWLMGTTFKSIDKNKKAKAEAAKAAAVKAAPTPAPAPAPVVEEVEEEDDDEIIAVISAAIAAYAEEEGTSYTIRDIKRRDKRTRSAWSLAGIGENTRPF